MKQIINQIFTNFNHINIQKGHKIILHKHKIHQIINLLSVIIKKYIILKIKNLMEILQFIAVQMQDILHHKLLLYKIDYKKDYQLLYLILNILTMNLLVI